MIRIAFARDIKALRQDMIEMTRLTEVAIANAVLAVENKDYTLAKQVYDGDTEINNLQVQIEKRCIQMIAKQQPVAGDVRLIVSILKMATDLERIGDHAADISEQFLGMPENTDADNAKPWDVSSLHEMAELVIIMLNDSINAFLEQSLELARSIRKQDEKVNQHFKDTLDKLAIRMQESLDNDTIERCIGLILIAKYLERIGDHSKNIAEWVIYAITGELVF